MYFPTWVDLKGQDSVPDTVHHVVNQLYTCISNWYVLHQWGYLL